MTGYKRIVNRDGALVGLTEDGNEVPIEIKELESKTHSTEEVNTVRWVTPEWTPEEITALLKELSSSGGGTVKFESGTYELSGHIPDHEENHAAIHLQDNVNLIGQGKSTVLRLVEETNAMRANYELGTDPEVSDGNNIIIEGFHFDGNVGAYTREGTSHDNSAILLHGFQENVTIRNCWATDFETPAYHFDAPRNCRFENLVGYDIDSQGIHFSTRLNGSNEEHGPRDSWAVGCHFENLTQNAIEIGNAADANSGERSGVAFCTIDGARTGIRASGEGIAVIGCGIRDTLLHGIHFSTMPVTGGNSVTPLILGCQIHDATGDNSKGIRMDQGVETPQVGFCHIENITDSAIRMDDTVQPTVSNITAYGGGIRFDSTCTEPSVTDSVVLDGGVRLESDGARLSNVRIHHSFGGLRIDGSNVNVSEAYVTNDGGDGFNITAGSSDVVIMNSYVNADRSNVDNEGTDVWFVGVNPMANLGALGTGTRTVVNGLSENAGDPSVTGDWFGTSVRAYRTGVTVYDSENDEYYHALHPTATNDWAQNNITKKAE